jgi:hypothetical protein
MRIRMRAAIETVAFIGGAMGPGLRGLEEVRWLMLTLEEPGTSVGVPVRARTSSRDEEIVLPATAACD